MMFAACLKAMPPIRTVFLKSDRSVLGAEQRVVREGSSPSGAQMRSVISESGDKTSLAGESGRYGDV